MQIKPSLATLPENPKVAVLIVAAGRGARFGNQIPKQYCMAAGEPVLRHTIVPFLESHHVDLVQVVIHESDKTLYQRAVHGLDILPSILGGDERTDSVRAGLHALSSHDPDIVLIHDAARPNVSISLIERIIRQLQKHQAVIPVTPLTDTIKSVKNERITATENRHALFAAQTPQGFRFRPLFKLHQENTTPYTDDALLCEEKGLDVFVIEGDPYNQKITRREDLTTAEFYLLHQRPVRVPRTGNGFDVHRFTSKRKDVTLGGITIPYKCGLEGHSDADVVIHALVDALLGAMVLGDIGEHFSPQDPRWKNAPSSVFLEHCFALLQERHAKFIHADVTIIAEAPKISPHKSAMQSHLAAILHCPPSHISIKATTTEGLGFTGRKEGIAAQATATILM